MRLRPDDGIHVESMVRRKLVEIALAVRDQPDLETAAAEYVEHGERVLVEGEVLVPLPLAHHVGRARSSTAGVAAHAEHDLLGERDPDLFVVDELAVPLQLLDRCGARFAVAIGVEDEPVPPDSPIPLGRARGQAA
jgi:hypothetical protein